MKKKDKFNKTKTIRKESNQIGLKYNYSSITCIHCNSNYHRDANSDEIHKFLKLNKDESIDKKNILTCYECHKSFYYDPYEDFEEYEKQDGYAKSDIYDS